MRAIRRHHQHETTFILIVGVEDNDYLSWTVWQTTISPKNGLFMETMLKTYAIFAAALAAISLTISAQAEELNLYSSRHYDTDERLYSDFTAATGIKINRIEARRMP